MKKVASRSRHHAILLSKTYFRHRRIAKTRKTNSFEAETKKNFVIEKDQKTVVVEIRVQTRVFFLSKWFRPFPHQLKVLVALRRGQTRHNGQKSVRDRSS